MLSAMDSMTVRDLFFSSMLAWKVSYIMRKCGWLTCLDQGAGVGGGGQEIALEAVEILDGEHDLGLLRVLGGLAQHVGGAFLLVGGRPGAGEDAERRMIGPAQVVAAERGRHVDGPLDALEAGLRTAASGLIGLAVGRDDGDGGAAEAVVVQLLARSVL